MLTGQQQPRRCVIPRVRAGIIGGGPAGLLLACLLQREDISTIVLEPGSEQQAGEPGRAAVLGRGAVSLLERAGLGRQLGRGVLTQDQLELRVGGTRHWIDVAALAGAPITACSQRDLRRDLTAALRAAGGTVLFGAPVTGIDGLGSGQPVIRFRHGGATRELHCELVTDCGGVSRRALPPRSITCHHRSYPLAWLTLLAAAPASAASLVCAASDLGLAAHHAQSRQQTWMCLQCDPRDQVSDWPDERIWEQLHARLATDDAWTLRQGPLLQRAVVPLGSCVTEPMQYGPLFLAGDAAHLVSPAGLNGLSLALADVEVLAEALITRWQDGDPRSLDSYSARRRPDVWRAVWFAHQMTMLLHRLPGADGFARQLQQAELDLLASSEPAQAALAAELTGQPRPRPAARPGEPQMTASPGQPGGPPRETPGPHEPRRTP